MTSVPSSVYAMERRQRRLRGLLLYFIRFSFIICLTFFASTPSARSEMPQDATSDDAVSGDETVREGAGQRGAVLLSEKGAGVTAVVDSKPGHYDALVEIQPLFPRRPALNRSAAEEVLTTLSGEGRFPIDLRRFGLDERVADDHTTLQILYRLPYGILEPSVGIEAVFHRVLTARPGRAAVVDERGLYVRTSSNVPNFVVVRKILAKDAKWRRFRWGEYLKESLGLRNSGRFIVRGSGSSSKISLDTQIDIDNLAKISLRLNECSRISGIYVELQTGGKKVTLPVPLDAGRRFASLALGSIKYQLASTSGGKAIVLTRLVATADADVEQTLSCKPISTIEEIAEITKENRSRAMVSVEGQVIDLGDRVRALQIPLNMLWDRTNWGQRLTSLELVLNPNKEARVGEILLLNVSLTHPNQGQSLPKFAECSELSDERYAPGAVTLGPCPTWVHRIHFGSFDLTSLSGVSTQGDFSVSASPGVRYRIDDVGAGGVSFSLNRPDDFVEVKLKGTSGAAQKAPLTVDLEFTPSLRVLAADGSMRRPGVQTFKSASDLTFRISDVAATASSGMRHFVIRPANSSGRSSDAALQSDVCVTNEALNLCRLGSLDDVEIRASGISMKGVSEDVLRINLDTPLSLPANSSVRLDAKFFAPTNLPRTDADSPLKRAAVRFELEVFASDGTVVRKAVRPGDTVPLFAYPTSIRKTILNVVPAGKDVLVRQEKETMLVMEGLSFSADEPSENGGGGNTIYTVQQAMPLPISDLSSVPGARVQSRPGAFAIFNVNAQATTGALAQWETTTLLKIDEIQNLDLRLVTSVARPSQFTLEIEAQATEGRRVSRFKVPESGNLNIEKADFLPSGVNSAAVPQLRFRLFAEAGGGVSSLGNIAVDLQTIAVLTKDARDLALLFPVVEIAGRAYFLDHTQLDNPQLWQDRRWVNLGAVEISGPTIVKGGDNPIFRANSIFLDPSPTRARP